VKNENEIRKARRWKDVLWMIAEIIILWKLIELGEFEIIIKLMLMPQRFVLIHGLVNAHLSKFR